MFCCCGIVGEGSFYFVGEIADVEVLPVQLDLDYEAPVAFVPADALVFARSCVTALLLVHIVLRGCTPAEVEPLIVEPISVSVIYFYVGIGDTQNLSM